MTKREIPPTKKSIFFHGLSQKSSLTLWKLSEKGCCNLTLPQKEITVKSNNNSTTGTTTAAAAALINLTLTLTPLINTHHYKNTIKRKPPCWYHFCSKFSSLNHKSGNGKSCNELWYTHLIGGSSPTKKKMNHKCAWNE